MAAPKGHPRWGGRQRGTSNKLTTAAKEAIEKAFANIGGVDALTEWARANKDTFYSRVWTKIIPLQVGDEGEQLVVKILRLSNDGTERPN